MAEDKDREERDRKDAEAGKTLDTILSHLDSLHKRLDAMEEKDRKDAEEEVKKDAEETIRYFGKGSGERKDEEEEEVKAKADAEAEEKEKADSEKEEEKKDAERKEEEVKADKAKKDEEEGRKDSEAADIRAAIKRLERTLPKAMSDQELSALADVQSRADSVFHALGSSAPRPMTNEDASSYRRRVAVQLKQHSPKYKGVNISSITDENLFSAIEESVYVDAMVVANSPATAPAGSLRAVSRKEGGHEFISYVGDPAAWMNPIAGPVRMHVTNINQPNGSAR